MNKSSSRTVAFGFFGMFVLSACGGGGGGGGCEDDCGPPPGPSLSWTTPPAPATNPPVGTLTSGIFRDSAVSGLDYTSGSVSGVTAADGAFDFQAGSSVTFRIGAVTIGSGVGQFLMTALGLDTPSGGIPLTYHSNVHRFLQMLDLDGNPDNGIQISAAARALAVNWPAVDFASGDFANSAAVQQIIADASAADGFTHVLPSETAAAAHFDRAFQCAYSGLFRGSITGSGENGVFAVVSYGTGLVWGAAFSNVDEEMFFVEDSRPMVSVLNPFVSLGTTNIGATFEGRFASPNVLLGSWENGPDRGSFLGGRSGGAIAPRYRITGFQFPVGTALLMSFEIDALNQISGSVLDLDPSGNGQPVTLSGSLSGTEVTAAATGNRYTLTGTFDTSASATNLRLSGVLRDTAKNRNVEVTLPACQLF